MRFSARRRALSRRECAGLVKRPFAGVEGPLPPLERRALLCEDADEFAEALGLLIEDARLRAALGASDPGTSRRTTAAMSCSISTDR
jgi:hypothetical protein